MVRATPAKKRTSRKKAAPRQASARNQSSILDQFLDRDLGWLEFNRRVLMLAADARIPLLERINFLSIFSSNLDEFFMKRVGALRRLAKTNMSLLKPKAKNPAALMTAIREKTLELIELQGRIYEKQIRPELKRNHIVLAKPAELTTAERSEADEYFQTHVFPVLTPLAVDPGHPFPFISNNSISLGIVLSNPGSDKKMFARIKVPAVLPAFVRLFAADDHSYRFVSLIDLICLHVDKLFEGMEIKKIMPFRITRNAEIELDEEEADDLLDMISEEIRLRRFEQVIRLKYSGKPVQFMLNLLQEHLHLDRSDIYEAKGLLDYTDLRLIADLPIPNLHWPRWSPVPSKQLGDDESDIFSTIRSRDILVHHPYESFSSSVERFVTAAAEDPRVVAIKITLYRTAEDSPFIPALIRAAEDGKQVVTIIELKARFDEQRNIHLAQRLEEAGIHVVYGMVGFKTHTKITLIVRNESDGIQCYAHIGTGNYHIHTAKLYTDLSLFTCRTDITQDLVELFHFMTGKSLKHEYLKLLVAPINMKARFLEMIQREKAHKKEHKPAQIIAKMNSLEDRDICEALYQASQAGVPITLIVRGFCCLRPGVKGLSDTIEVFSILGRFLEHSRIFYFAAGQADRLDGEYYIGSSDWMHRNLERRVEVITPVEDGHAKTKLWEILDTMIHDHCYAWEMESDGSYRLRKPSRHCPVADTIGTHARLIELVGKNG
jgi:polyphosphate kinase